MTYIENVEKGQKMRTNHRRKNKVKSTKGPGYEYWGTRDSGGPREPGKPTKTLTHRRERRKGKAVDYMDAAGESLRQAETLAGKPVMTDQQFLESMSKADELIDHDGETCGMCSHQIINAQVAREMLATGGGTTQQWCDETQRRWREGKFFKTWQAAVAAKKDPYKVFEKKGWEP